ncbi:MAG: acetyltransferase [Elusimicrobia bacterium]|jgi:sugar O-acyltransferase (sialic acid O-acetyltransferase NeuD family)|nr:acetyltransferase [Elusimicrobiota bacterium]
MKKKKQIRIVLLGTGGHARVLMDALRSCTAPFPEWAMDKDRKKWGSKWEGIRIFKGDDSLQAILNMGATHYVVGVGGNGDNRARARLFVKLKASGLDPFSVRHSSAVVSPGAILGSGVQLLPGCVVNAGAVIGENVIINSRAVVEHDCFIEEHVHVAPGAVLCGGVYVGKGSHIGAGAVIRQKIRIGSQSLVGAGAVVVRDVPPNTWVVGIAAESRGRFERVPFEKVNIH